jgi:hypothetical protein
MRVALDSFKQKVSVQLNGIIECEQASVAALDLYSRGIRSMQYRGQEW